MKLIDISNVIEDFAPITLAEDYDNCGFIFGDTNAEYLSALVTLDLTPKVAEEAITRGCNIIIEHHPTIFYPIKFLDIQNPAHIAFKMCIENNIAIYSAHTNIDNVSNGLKDSFIKKIGFKPINNLNGITTNLAILPHPILLKELVTNLRDKLKDDSIFFVGDPFKIIKKAYCVNGAGGNEENLYKSMQLGADVMISSEYKHHVLRFAKDSDYAIISTSHFASEESFSDLINGILTSNNIPNVVIANNCLNPITKEKYEY